MAILGLFGLDTSAGSLCTSDTYSDTYNKTVTPTVTAALTNEARYFLSRGITDGTVLSPIRYQLGTSLAWDNQWQFPPDTSLDVNSVGEVLFTGSLADGNLVIEQANNSTVSLKCKNPSTSFDTSKPTELLVFARIINSPFLLAIGLDIAFASCRLQPWFLSPVGTLPAQQIITRIIIPLGCGGYIEP